MGHGGQVKRASVTAVGSARSRELVIPNPKPKLMDQMREVPLERLRVEG